MRHARRRVGRWGGRLALVCTAALTVVAVGAGQAAAASTVTPVLDCVANGGSDGSGGTIYTAYFGYTDSDANSDTIAVGGDNVVIPGDQFQGQPTTFNPGSYPSTFAVEFDTAIVPFVQWVLNGQVVGASPASTPCIAGSTGTASSVTTTDATLDGVIDPLGSPTTYNFEWGTSPTSLQSTSVLTVTSSDPQLVTAALTNLTPGTTYYYELVANNGRVSTTGALESFTTATVPVSATAALTLTGSASSSSDVVGKPLTYTFTVSNAGPDTAAGTVMQIVLPDGVKTSSVAGAPGGCTGTTLLQCQLGGLAPNGSVRLTLTVTPQTSRTLQTTAFVTSGTPNTTTTGDVATLRTAVKAKPKRHKHHRHTRRAQRSSRL